MKTRNFWMIVFAIFAMMFFSACVGAVTGPDDPNDNEVVEHYDYTVTYIRPPGSIVRPERADPSGIIVQFKNDVREILTPTKINDYEFTGTIVGVPTHLKKEGTLPPNRMYVVDAKRWIDMFYDGGLWYGIPHTVGDIFKLKNLKTGEEVTLTNIAANSLNPTWPPQCEAKEVHFWTVKGGLIKNAWPY